MLTRQSFLRGVIALVASWFGAKGTVATAEARIDATTKESYENSFRRATVGMTADQRIEVIAAISTLWAERPDVRAFDPNVRRDIQKGVHGMTAKEILDAVRV